MDKRSVQELARAIADKALTGTEYVLVDVAFKSEQGAWNLYVYVDKPGGITMDDCETISKLLDPLFDEHPSIAGVHDFLSVSSPGADRPIASDADYARNIGRVLDVRLYSAVGKRKDFTGVLQAFDADTVCLTQGDADTCIELRRSNIAKAVQHIDFK